MNPTIQPNTPLLYVAGAYSGDIESNIATAEQVSIALIRNGFHVITPHKNTAGYEKYESSSTMDYHNLDYTTWINMDLNILSRCDAIYAMANSNKSKGAQAEIEYALAKNIPIINETQFPPNQFTLNTYHALMNWHTCDWVNHVNYGKGLILNRSINSEHYIIKFKNTGCIGPIRYSKKELIEQTNYQIVPRNCKGNDNKSNYKELGELIGKNPTPSTKNPFKNKTTSKLGDPKNQISIKDILIGIYKSN